MGKEERVEGEKENGKKEDEKGRGRGRLFGNTCASCLLTFLPEDMSYENLQQQVFRPPTVDTETKSVGSCPIYITSYNYKLPSQSIKLTEGVGD